MTQITQIHTDNNICVNLRDLRGEIECRSEWSDDEQVDLPFRNIQHPGGFEGRLEELEDPDVALALSEEYRLGS